jgi:hypothetical protein
LYHQIASRYWYWSGCPSPPFDRVMTVRRRRPMSASAPSPLSSTWTSSLPSPMIHEGGLACENTWAAWALVGDFSGWAGNKLENTWDVNGLARKFGDHRGKS